MNEQPVLNQSTSLAVKLANEKNRLSFPVGPLILLLSTVISQIVAFLLGYLELKTVITLACIQITLIAVCFIAVKANKKSFLGTTYFKKKLTLKQILLIIALCPLVICSFFILATLFDMLLQEIGYAGSTDLGTDEGVHIVIMALVIGIGAGFGEEILFRGVLLNSFRNKSKMFAIIFSAICFSLFHMNPQQTVYQFSLGVILAFVVIETRSIWAGVILHFLNNFVSVLFLGDIIRFIFKDSLHTGLIVLAVASIVCLPLLYLICRQLSKDAHKKEGKPKEEFKFIKRLNTESDSEYAIPYKKSKKAGVIGWIILGITLGLFSLMWLINFFGISM